MNNLENKKLELLHITRQSVIDATFVCACDNCGRAIVNIAEVQEIETGKKFNIGLDCKATLFKEDKDKAKRTIRRDMEKFLLLVSKDSVKISCDRNEIILYDYDQNTDWGTPGKIVFMESSGYLLHNGIKKEFLEQLLRTKQDV